MFNLKYLFTYYSENQHASFIIDPATNKKDNLEMVIPVETFLQFSQSALFKQIIEEQFNVRF